MKNIALIKSIVATSISSANPAELTEHIAALIQAHPEETRENALAILTGTARPRYTYQEPLKLQNVDKVTEEDRALMDVARDMWAGVIKKGLWALSLIAFCYGWQNSTCCRWNSFNRSYFSQHCKSFIDCYYSAQCNYWDVHCRTRS